MSTTDDLPVTATVTCHGRDIVAWYHGGPYVDLGFLGTGAAFDVINVWDCETDRPTIACTHEAVLAAVQEWAAQTSAYDLANFAY